MNRPLAWLGFCLLLTACAGSPEREDIDTAEAGENLLLRLSRTLPGQYSNFNQQWRQTERNLRLLDIALIKRDPGQVWLLSRQTEFGTDGQPAATRQQLISIHSEPDGALVYRFAPYRGEAHQALQRVLSSAAEFLPGCDIRLHLTPAAVVGKSSPADCRLGKGRAGLAKSVKLQNDRITIADQVIDSHGIAGREVIHVFERVHHYTGWAGFKTPQSDWQSLPDFRISSDGRIHTLLDASGEPTSIRIRLAAVDWKAGEEKILRLDQIDPRTGRPLHYVFSTPGAATIGFHLGDLQVGLRRLR